MGSKSGHEHKKGRILGWESRRMVVKREKRTYGRNVGHKVHFKDKQRMDRVNLWWEDK